MNFDVMCLNPLVGRAVDYNKAICAAVDRLNKKQGASSLVLDVGAGSGLLTMMASRAGASKVIACEMMPVRLRPP